MIVVTDRDPRFHARVAGHLARRDLLEVAGVPELQHVLEERAGEIDVVLLGPSVSPEEALRVAAGVQKRAPDVSVLFVADAVSSELLQEALRSGVRDILSGEFTAEQLQKSVARAEELSHQLRERATSPNSNELDSGPSPVSEVITVFSSKGGVGKSFIATNIAVLLAQRTGGDVALVDLDLQFGDLAIMLQLFPARTMYDAAQAVGSLDPEALKAYGSPHKSGMKLFAAPFEPGLADTIQAETIATLLKIFRHAYRYVIIDTPAMFNEHVVAALDDSDHCILVTSMDVPSIKNVKLALQTLELLGFNRDHVRLALNRADAEVGLRVNEVEKTLGRRVDVSVPSGREVPLSINRGVPLATEAPYSPAVLSLTKLVDSLGASHQPIVATEKPRRLFGKRRAG